MKVSNHLHSPASLTRGELSPVVIWKGTWVSPRAGLGVMAKTKISVQRGIESRTSIPHSVPY